MFHTGVTKPGALIIVILANIWFFSVACPVHASELSERPAIVLRAVGADSMDTLMQCWGDAFTVQYPNVQIEYTAGLSADGAVAMIEQKADLAPFAREYFPAEVAAFHRAFLRQPALVRVASGSFANRGKTHSLAVYVHRDNPIESLSLQQLNSIFTSPGGLTWGELGLEKEWHSLPVKSFGMLNVRDSGNPPGIVNFMRHVINGGQPLSNAIKQMPGDENVHALKQIVNAVGNDRIAVGYSGFLFANENSKIVPVSTTVQSTAVSGSASSVRSHDYPLSRYIYLSVSPVLDGARQEAVIDFIDFVHGKEGQACVEHDPAEFFALPKETLAAERARVKHFFVRQNNSPAKYWTEDGRVRVVGYNDMDQILTAMNSLFSQLNPGIEFELILKGTRTAPPALADGTSAFAPMGAEFSGTALEEYRQIVGSDPLAIRVAHASLSPDALSGPLALFVNTANPLNDISLTEAARIFSVKDGLEPIQTWGQLGLEGEWARQPIEPCGLAPKTALGTLMRKHKFSNAPFAETVIGFGQSRDAVQFAVNHPAALCFAAYNRKVEGVKALAVSMNDEGVAYEATEEAVMNGHYPLDRYLRIYVRNSADSGIDPLVSDYIRMVLSPGGQAMVKSTPRGYLPLNAAEIETELAKLLQ